MKAWIPVLINSLRSQFSQNKKKKNDEAVVKSRQHDEHSSFYVYEPHMNDQKTKAIFKE
jgi:hypothetical protein